MFYQISCIKYIIHNVFIINNQTQKANVMKFLYKNFFYNKSNNFNRNIFFIKIMKFVRWLGFH